MLHRLMRRVRFAAHASEGPFTSSCISATGREGNVGCILEYLWYVQVYYDAAAGPGPVEATGPALRLVECWIVTRLGKRRNTWRGRYQKMTLPVCTGS